MNYVLFIAHRYNLSLLQTCFNTNRTQKKNEKKKKKLFKAICKADSFCQSSVFFSVLKKRSPMPFCMERIGGQVHLCWCACMQQDACRRLHNHNKEHKKINWNYSHCALMHYGLKSLTLFIAEKSLSQFTLATGMMRAAAASWDRQG